ncbi:hypothetical protein GCM10011519_33380 [Marmoricola endophyticus]|uniref:Uncharacterized protein n=1 Tax=Marmoricola endophyticus TaxID=2040280 RepID=A0A917BTF9_9ACTN|nr:hypothetical protein [Marmoricola endophyticus]GGF56789.1 hypothetical protein GCM10011519_33380 [Marmoricola endophyticus]
MSDLPPGVTRYPADRRRVTAGRSGSAAALFSAVLVVVAVVAVLEGADAVRVLVVALVALVVPVATAALPWTRVRTVLSVVAALAVFFALGVGGAANVFLLFTALSALAAGLTLGAVLERRWRWQRRLAGAEGAPPAGRDPRGGKDVGVLAWWADVDHQYEMVDPTVEVVLDAVRALDGRERSVVSVYRGTGRLDVAGNASGVLVVQQSDDRAHWCQVVGPDGVPGSEDALGVVVAGAVLGVQRRRTTDRETAERVMRTWLVDGTRDSSVRWEPHSAWGRAQDLRPAWLRSTD